LYVTENKTPCRASIRTERRGIRKREILNPGNKRVIDCPSGRSVERVLRRRKKKGGSIRKPKMQKRGREAPKKDLGWGLPLTPWKSE